MSHDIDFVTKYKSIRNVLGAFKRGEKNIFKIYQKYSISRRDRTLDPYWTMQDMLLENNKRNIPTRFYFKTAITNKKYDVNDYGIFDLDVKELLFSLKSQGALIGLHPSYETYLDGDQIKYEKELLEEVVHEDITHSRQHYLRYENPTTFKLLAQAGIQEDSSIGPQKSIVIPENNGNKYVIYQDQSCTLLQQPFMMMETHLLHAPHKMLEELRTYVQKIKNNAGTAMLIWHNNNYETDIQREVYAQVLDIIRA